MPTELDSPRWQELPHCWEDQRLVEALSVLLSRVDSSEHTAAKRNSALATIHDSIFHQTSTYPATYITVPHLVAVIDRLSEDDKLSVLHLVAWISTQGEPHGELTPQEIQEYKASLATLTKKSEIVFHEAQGGDTESMITLLASIAALRGSSELWQALYHGVEEHRFPCPECQSELMSKGHATSEMDADSKDYLLSDDGSPQYWLPIRRTLVFNDVSEDVTPRDEFPESSPVVPLFELTVSTNRWRLQRWLKHYFGYSRCPSCHQNMDLLGCIVTS